MDFEHCFPPVVSYSWSCGIDDQFLHVRSIHLFTRNLIEPQLLPEREYLEHRFFFFPQYNSLIILFFQPDESYHFHEFRPTNARLVIHILQNAEYSMVIRGPSPNSCEKFLCSLRYGATQCHTHIHIHTSDKRLTHTRATRAIHILLNAFEYIYATHTHRTT